MKIIKFIIFLIIITSVGGVLLYKLLSDYYYKVDIILDAPGPEINTLYRLRSQYRSLKIRQYELYSIQYNADRIEQEIDKFQNIYYDLYREHCKTELMKTDYVIMKFHSDFKLVDDLILPSSFDISATGYKLIRDPLVKVPYSFVCNFRGSNNSMNVTGVVKFPFFKTLNKELKIYELLDKN